MPTCYKKEKAHQILEDEFDVRFIYEDFTPIFDFYPITKMELTIRVCNYYMPL